MNIIFMNSRFSKILDPHRQTILPDGLHSVLDIQEHFECNIKKNEAMTDNPPIETYVNKR